ncbi:MAG TPA: PP2C family protein-serine/threonine phosphatase, partial [Anaerolineales bacterium]|nr:PP2C family protein-serine/threonine phosphatase [Anaerolineales bacterium]
PPLLVSPTPSMNVTPLPRTGMPLGVLEEAVWGRGVARLACGDLLLLCTDGVTEAQNIQGQFYADERLQQMSCLAQRAQSDAVPVSAQGILNYLLQDIHAFIGPAPRADDLTMVVLRREN